MSTRRGPRPSPGGWRPWWATVLSIIALLVCVTLLGGAVFSLYWLFSGGQYGIAGLPLGLTLIMLAALAGFPSIAYLMSRQRRTFVVSMLALAPVVAIFLGFVLLNT